MKIPSESEIVHMWGAEKEKVSLHVWLRYVWEENGMWNLHVIVDDLTTAEELRGIWGHIQQSREVLKQYQGSDPNRYSIALMQYIDKRNKSLSYGKLAEELNFEALLYIIGSTSDRFSEKEQAACKILFMNLFHTLGLKNPDIQAWEAGGRKAISNGKLPWGVKNGPMERDRVIRSLRTYRERIATGEIVIMTDTGENYMQKYWLWLLQRGIWQRAKSFLEKDDEGTFRKFLPQIIYREKRMLTTVSFPGRKIT